MGRPVCQAYVDRNEKILAAYQTGKTFHDLGEEFGLSYHRLREIIVARGVPLRREFKKKFVLRRSRSNVLIMIGARLHADRMKRGLSLTEYSVLIGLSEVRLQEALQGLYDWKFSEMARAADTLAVRIEAFLQPRGVPNG